MANHDTTMTTDHSWWSPGQNGVTVIPRRRR